MTDVSVSTGGGPWKTLGHLNNCQACLTEMPPFNTKAARYEWWPRTSGGPRCPTRLCVECCVKWRAEVEAGKRPTPLRISEIDPPGAPPGTVRDDHWPSPNSGVDV